MKILFEFIHEFSIYQLQSKFTKQQIENLQIALTRRKCSHSFSIFKFKGRTYILQRRLK